MLGYIVRRLVLMIPTLFLVSVVSFIAIQLPPGDYLTSYASQLSSMGESVNQEALNSLRERYGLGEPVYVQVPADSVTFDATKTAEQALHG